MSKFRKASGLGSLAALLLLLGVAPTTAQEKIRVGIVSFYAPMVTVYAAEDLGLYKKNGVEAEITGFRGGAPAQEALVADAIDIYPSTPIQITRAKDKGVKQFIVAPITLGPMGWHVLVPTDSPVQSLKDLNGKSVGISATGGLSDSYAIYIAHRAGISINRVPVGSGGVIPALTGKQVDAAVMPSPTSYQVLFAKTGRSILDLGKEIGPNNVEVWASAPAFIEQHHKAISGFLRSIYQSLDYMKKNRSYSLAYLKKFTTEPDDRIVAALYDDVIMQMPDRARISSQELDATLAFGKDSGALKTLPAHKDIYSDTFASVDGK